MSATPVQPAGWPRPRGYSNGMKAKGELVAVAGQVGWDDSGKLVEGGFVPQFEQALKNVLTVVETAGGEAQEILSLTIFVTSIADYMKSLELLGQAYRRVLGKNFPAMALVEVRGLVDPEAEVEIQALAVIVEDVFE
jgi:enamine deaminase RidA (YjgF/YER057c/UK114 family)